MEEENTITVYDNFYIFDDLTENSTYNVYLRAICGSENSSWIFPISFTTNPTCTSPTNLTISQITGTSALVSWNAAPLGATGYTLSYTAAEEENWISETVTELQYMLTGLEQNTPYIVTVTSECDEGTAPSISKNFTTHCLAGGEIPIGDGSTTNTYIPSYSTYNYGYSQQIFLSSEMNGPTDITSISLNMSNLIQQRNYTIYMAHTTATDLSSGWASTEGAQLVFSGPQALTTEWNTFDFAAPFSYNGTDNLLVIFVDSTGSWQSGNSWYVHNAFSGSARYIYEDGSPYSLTPPSGAGTSLSVRNNVIFGGDCDETVTCIAPNAFLSDITPESMTLSWVAGYNETSWEVEYCSDTADWISLGTVTTSPYTIDNLEAHTTYYVRIRSICGGGDFSNWKTMQATTSICEASEQCVYTFNLTDDFGDGWNGGTLEVQQNGISVATIGLTSGSSATETVTLCDNSPTSIIWHAGSFVSEVGFSILTPYGEELFSFNDMSNYTEYTFLSNCTMPNCPSPVKNSVTASNIDGHNATISFMDNDPEHNSWTIYYRMANAQDNEEWLTLVTDETSATLTDLAAETTYEVYVITNCDTPDEVPDATHIIQFTTSITCPAPQNVTVSNIGMTSATISWFSNAESFSIEYGEAGFTPGTGITATTTDTTYELTDLTASTSYTVYLTADCGSEGTSAPAIVNFNTSICEVADQCIFTFNLTDSYGDGWNGASLEVKQNGTTVVTLGISTGYSATETVSLCNNMPTSLVWHSGSYDSEAGFNIVNPFGEEIYTITGMSGYSTVTFTSSCSMPNCPSPVKNSVTASDIDGHNATISFIDNDPEHNSWTVYYREANATLNDPWMTEVTSTTSVTLTNLTAETTYDVYVITNCATPDEVPDATYTIQFTTMVACPAPQDLAVSGITTNAATITWFSNAESFTLEYGEAGFTPGSGTTVTTTETTYELTGLATATSYTVNVTADCGVEGVSSSSSVYFATACETVALPYTENFDSYTGTTYTDANGIAPNCWTTYSTNTTYGAPHITSDGSYHYVHSGTNCMVFTCGAAGSDAYAALPAFDQSLNTLHLNFWRAMESTSYGTLTVGYVTNVGDMASTFVAVATIPSVGSSAGDTISVDFTGADIPANGNICFHWNHSSSYYSCCIDDIQVTSNGSGPGPVTNPTVATNAASGVTQTSATLNGTITNPDNVTITAKGFEWKTTVGGSYTPVTVTGNNLTYNLTGLTANTGYTFKAFITYNGTTVYGSEMTFTTLPEDVQPCEVPTGLTASNITKESFTVTWNDNAGVSSWNIQYRPQNGQLSSATTNTNHYDFTNLIPETVYEVQVQANCGNNNLSEWSEILSVTTLTDGIEDHLFNSIALYPNPANEYVDVRVDGEVNVKSMEVFDVYGKLINTVNVIDNPTRINVSGLANGMYFVRVTTEQGVATKTFVKK
jgi:hypothetical protein